MTELPSVMVRGERARLFPVLADTSKEGRSLSILLACIENVREFGGALLIGLGQRIGTRSHIRTYTEVVLQKAAPDRKCRPDGLLMLRSGSNEWTALVEAKVGNSDLTDEQIEAYIDLAKINGVDALITISNQFAPLPTHHPVQLSGSARRKISLYHWSWQHVLTAATLLLANDEVVDRDQRVILNEMVRFLSHPSAGVRSFDQMPSSWTPMVAAVQAGGIVSPNSPDAREVIGAWHQEVRDLSLVLSRWLGRDVYIRIPRAHSTDPIARQKADLARLGNEHSLTVSLNVPDAAGPIEVSADLQKRSISVSMKIRAPDDRKSIKARLNWLLRQIQKSQPNGIHVRLFWPGRAGATQHPLTSLRDNPDLASTERADLTPTSFEVLFVRDLGAKFGQRRNFISELEAAVPEFYEQVGQYLKPWQAPAPKVREEKPGPVDVTTEEIQEVANEVALARQE
jgi:hypothetical protein